MNSFLLQTEFVSFGFKDNKQKPNRDINYCFSNKILSKSYLNQKKAEVLSFFLKFFYSFIFSYNFSQAKSNMNKMYKVKQSNSDDSVYGSTVVLTERSLKKNQVLYISVIRFPSEATSYVLLRKNFVSN